MNVTDPEMHRILRTNGEMAVVVAAKLPAPQGRAHIEREAGRLSGRGEQSMHENRTTTGDENLLSSEPVHGPLDNIASSVLCLLRRRRLCIQICTLSPRPI